MDKKQKVAFWALVLVAIFSTMIISHGLYVSSRISFVNTYHRIDYIDQKISRMTMRERVSSLFILHPAGKGKDEIVEFAKKYKPAGLIFMNDNIASSTMDFAEITKSLDHLTDFPLLLAVDEEGGLVKRFSEDIFGSALDLKDSNPEDVAEAFRSRTNMLLEMGLNLNFGIVADITGDSSSYIYSRSFGGNPAEVGQKVSSAVASSNAKTLSTIKHFPGHGETVLDSHSSIPSSDKSYNSWLSTTAVPFLDGINSGVDCVMFGHLVFSDVDERPATLSQKWHEILNKELGFKGLSITDDMRMLSDSGDLNYDNPTKNAIDALTAGNDILLYVLGPDQAIDGVTIDMIIDDIVKAIEAKTIKYSQIHKSLKKVLNVRRSLI